MTSQTATIDEILERYPGEPRYLISLLQDIQAEYGYISNDAMTLVCDHAGVPVSRAWSVATFYRSFSLEPRGEHELKVCLGTACHLKGAHRIVDHVTRKIGVNPGHTTPDLRLTFESVNCLGACAIAPVAVVDDKYHGRMTAKKMDKIIKHCSTE